MLRIKEVSLFPQGSTLRSNKMEKTFYKKDIMHVETGDKNVNELSSTVLYFHLYNMFVEDVEVSNFLMNCDESLVISFSSTYPQLDHEFTPRISCLVNTEDNSIDRRVLQPKIGLTNEQSFVLNYLFLQYFNDASKTAETVVSLDN